MAFSIHLTFVETEKFVQKLQGGGTVLYTGTENAHTNKDNRIFLILWKWENNLGKLVGIIFWNPELIGNELEFLLHSITDY